jgi:hypothetical protein
VWILVGSRDRGIDASELRQRPKALDLSRRTFWTFDGWVTLIRNLLEQLAGVLQILGVICHKGAVNLLRHNVIADCRTLWPQEGFC